jgi:hypothetical protein
MRTIEEIRAELDNFICEYQANVLINELMEAVAQLQREKCAEECLMIRKEIGNDVYVEKTKNKIEINEEQGFFNVIGIDKDSILNAKIWT